MPAPRRPAFRGVSAAALVVLLAAGSAGAAAPSPLVRPWTPAVSDSMVAWAAQARARFQTPQGDSATGPNQLAYDLVGKIGQRLLRSLGKERMIEAAVIEAAVDSLQLDTDVVVDPLQPGFVLMMVRNPFKPGADAVGYFYWFREDVLRYQGVVFLGGSAPRMRVWWTSRQEAPYEWGVLTRERDPESAWQLLLLHLNPDAYMWNLKQYEGNGPDIGAAGQAFWVDLNGDEQPEIVSWVKAQADSSFENCPGCPELLTERVFTEHDGAFGLHDSRLLPSPYASFVLFIRLLREKNRPAAARLLHDPAAFDQAVALGWGARGGKGSWKLEYVEPRQAWPRWLALRFQAARDKPLYVVHFTMKEGRWIIRDWARPRTPATAKKGGQGN